MIPLVRTNVRTYAETTVRGAACSSQAVGSLSSCSEETCCKYGLHTTIFPSCAGAPSIFRATSRSHLGCYLFKSDRRQLIILSPKVLCADKCPHNTPKLNSVLPVQVRPSAPEISLLVSVWILIHTSDRAL